MNPPISQNYVLQPPIQVPEREFLCTLTNKTNNNKDGDIYICTGYNINQYIALSLLGRGSFGQVLKCLDYLKHKEVAIKILNPNKSSSPSDTTEVNLLKYIAQNDPDNLFVKYFGDFLWHGYHCVVFELLGENLYDYLKRNNFVGMNLSEVHQISRQLVCALSRLSSLNVIHCDIKPENIALVYDYANHKMIKLIDFGSSCINGKAIYRYIQSRFYRAAEVVLEIGYDIMIDTWSVGCVLVELLVGVPLFPGNTEIDQVGYYIQGLGNIPNYLLKRSPKLWAFFEQTNIGLNYKNSAKFRPLAKSMMSVILTCQSVRKIVENPDVTQTDVNRINTFIDLVARMLVFDPQLRIKPGEPLLTHPFILNNWVQPISPIISTKYNCTPQVMTRMQPPGIQYQPSFGVLPINQTIPNSIYIPNQIKPQPSQLPHASQYLLHLNPPHITTCPGYIFNYSMPYHQIPMGGSSIDIYNNVLLQDVMIANTNMMPQMINNNIPPCLHCITTEQSPYSQRHP